MPWYEGTQEETVAASRERVFAVMTDYESMPGWQGPLSDCEVLARDAGGAATEVRYEIATPIRPVRYVLRHEEERPAAVRGELVEGDVKGFRGEWRFQPAGPDSTRVICSMAIDPGFWVPKKISGLLHDTVLRRAVADLKRHVEGGEPRS